MRRRADVGGAVIMNCRITSSVLPSSPSDTDSLKLRATLTGNRTLNVRTGDHSARVTVTSGTPLYLDGQLRIAR